MVLVITQHDLPEPGTDFGHAIMHPALKLYLDGFELRDHSLLRSDSPYGEGSCNSEIVDRAAERELTEGKHQSNPEDAVSTDRERDALPVSMLWRTK